MPRTQTVGQTFRKCNGKDHFAKMCKSKGNGRHTVKCVESEVQERDYAFVIENDSNTERVTFNVGGVDLLMLIDSGASNNIMDEDTWEMLKEKKITCVVVAQNQERTTLSCALI